MERTSRCPYCAETIEKVSKDHIFSKFLGGKREIDSCESCNKLFGHTFEAEATKSLQPLHAFIASCGLPLKSADVVWREAVLHEDKPYDILVKKGRVKVELSHRIPQRDAVGNLVSIECPSLNDAHKAIRERARKLPLNPSNVPIKRSRIKPEEMKGVTVDLEFGPALRKLALKMSLGLCSLLHGYNPIDFQEARARLKPQVLSPDNVVEAYMSYASLDSNRISLSHVIYIERNESGVYGIVQFFGCIQLYLRLLFYPVYTHLFDFGGGYRSVICVFRQNVNTDFG